MLSRILSFFVYRLVFKIMLRYMEEVRRPAELTVKTISTGSHC
jgi:hypothetical protein